MGYLISIITSHAIFLMTGYSNLLTDQHKEKYTPNIIDLSWKKEWKKNLYMFTRLYKWGQSNAISLIGCPRYKDGSYK